MIDVDVAEDAGSDKEMAVRSKFSLGLLRVAGCVEGKVVRVVSSRSGRVGSLNTGTE